MTKSPDAQAKPYNAATVKKPLIETAKTELPVSTTGMHARKRALREGRCVPARIARERKEAAAQAKLKAEARAEGAIVATAEAAMSVAPLGAKHFMTYYRGPRAGYIGNYVDAKGECVGFLSVDGTVNTEALTDAEKAQTEADEVSNEAKAKGSPLKGKGRVV